MFRLERVAASAHYRAIERCDKFKEKHGLDRIDHKDEDFRAFTAKRWNKYLAAKQAVKLAKVRLDTGCRNCLYGAPVKTKFVDPRSPADIAKYGVLLKAIEDGTIALEAAIAMRYSDGRPMVTKQGYIDIAEGSDIPF
jgi:hypothetical protein